MLIFSRMKWQRSKKKANTNVTCECTFIRFAERKLKFCSQIKVHSHGTSATASTNDLTIEVYIAVEVIDTSVCVWTDPFVATEPIAYVKKKMTVADAVVLCEWALKHSRRDLELLNSDTQTHTHTQKHRNTHSIIVVFFNRLFHYAYCQIFLSSKTVKHCDKGIDSCGNEKSGLPLISSYCNTCVYILQSNLQCWVIFYLHLRFVWNR